MQYARRRPFDFDKDSHKIHMILKRFARDSQRFAKDSQDLQRFAWFAKDSHEFQDSM
jgi:hypothetical protein